MPSFVPAERMYLGAVVKVNSKGEHVVRDVTMDSPADVAGLEQGDVLVALGEVPIHGLSEDELRELTTLVEGSKLFIKFRSPDDSKIRTRIVLYNKPEGGTPASTDVVTRAFTSLFNKVVYGHEEGVTHLYKKFEDEHQFLHHGGWEDGKTRRLRRAIVARLRNFPRIKAFAKWKDVSFFPDHYASDALDKEHRAKVAECHRSIFVQPDKWLEHLSDLSHIVTPASTRRSSAQKAKAGESSAAKMLGVPVVALESLFTAISPGVNRCGGNSKKLFTPRNRKQLCTPREEKPLPPPSATSARDGFAISAQMLMRSPELPHSDEWMQSRLHSPASSDAAGLSAFKSKPSVLWPAPVKRDVDEVRAWADVGIRRKAEMRVVLNDLGRDKHEYEVSKIILPYQCVWGVLGPSGYLEDTFQNIFYQR